MTTLIFPGEPRTTNHLYRYTCRGTFAVCYMTAVGKDLKQEYTLRAKSQWKKKPIKSDMVITVRLYFKNKIRGKQDIDNYNKLILDALTGTVWEDDSQIVDLTIQKLYDKANPRIEVDVYDTCLTD